MSNYLKQPRRPIISLRLLFASISVLFLLLPVAGLYWLKLYESALIRQTESELISQSAFAAALYKYHLQERLKIERPRSQSSYGLPLNNDAINRLISSPPVAKLDYATANIYPYRPSPKPATTKIDAAADRAGRTILPILTEAQRTTLSSIKVLDFHGIVVASQYERGRSFAHTREYQQARQGKPVSILRDRGKHKAMPLGSGSRNAKVTVYVALPVTLNNRLVGVVWANRTPNDLMQTFFTKRRSLTSMALGILLIALLLVMFLAYTLTRPIRQLIEKTRLIAANHPDGAVPLSNPVTSEIGELSQSIAAMANTLYHRNAYLREFTAHVSHGLKTPLTALQGSIELLSDPTDNMPTEQRQRFLQHMAIDVNRLKRMVTRLMELAKADVANKDTQTTTLTHIKAYLGNYKASTNTPHSALVLTIAYTEKDPANPLQVAIPESSLDAALSNLIDNSSQAGATEFKITVEQNKTTHRCILTCTDNGSGLSQNNAKKMFTPFFTTRPTEGGSGLGLSITRRLLESHGGDITFEPGASDKGACFVITLPIAP